MKVFAIMRVGDPQKMQNALEKHFQGNHQSIGNNEWLVSASMTAQEVSEKLGVTTTTNETVIGHAMILQVADYFGRAPRQIWDWLETKMEEASG